MKESITRLSLTISDALHPLVDKWLRTTPSRLRSAKLLQYLEIALLADENGVVLRSQGQAAQPLMSTYQPSYPTGELIPQVKAGLPPGAQKFVPNFAALEGDAERAAAAMGDKWG